MKKRQNRDKPTGLKMVWDWVEVILVVAAIYGIVAYVIPAIQGAK